MRILFLGDIVGDSGFKSVKKNLPNIILEKKIDFVCVNGENAATEGVGLTENIANELFNAGVDVITTGNHVWDQKEIYEFIKIEKKLLRPLNMNKNLPGSLFFKTILIVPWLFPEVVVGLLWKWMFNSIYGIINHFLSIANLINEPVTWLGNPDSAPWAIVITAIWKGYPIVMIFVLAGLQTIPKELYEAANLDGASKVQTFFFITIPMIKPILLVTLVLETVWWLKHFTLIWLLTQGGPVNATNVVSISIFRSAFESFRFGQAAATAVLVFFICIFISKLYKTLMTKNENE